MTITSKPTLVNDTDWITFNPSTRVVSWVQPNPLFDGNYTI